MLFRSVAYRLSRTAKAKQLESEIYNAIHRIGRDAEIAAAHAERKAVDLGLKAVESSPPEIPTTAVLALVWARRFFSPIAWIVRISSQRAALVCSSDGTNGFFGNVLVREVSPFSIWNPTRIRLRSCAV